MATTTPVYEHPAGHRQSIMDPVKRIMDLWGQETEYRDLAERIKSERLQLSREHAADPAVRAALQDLGEKPAPGEESVQTPVSIADFFEQSSPAPESPELKRAKSLADRSKWSPKLRKLIEEKFPEEGKEERIRRATERLRSVTLGKGLPKESVRFYAEDLDLEYDF